MTTEKPITFEPRRIRVFEPDSDGPIPVGWTWGIDVRIGGDLIARAETGISGPETVIRAKADDLNERAKNAQRRG